ncbi:putative O-methyltransferase [Bernardetia litoralis DSM 6794]|uniref:Putative O-methyltransferase n=1 Tax=Bernardetia litoralis (strain ATCC 23117 / DSM 6794 / NBRC 15988 / NCIMB 1366 / Fx l1 / Sio-4) TaxID=880071 RepID=I4AK93_BERLS|nr:class I SAM-dependent methyltransferase [Bernardetia litoralis]AFM04378.1 putative O-methyltransferase [Bernardetia litoralis DSM 6794]
MLLYALKYLYFYFKAGNQHAVHSPFVYQLYTLSIKNTKDYYAFSELENLRQELISDRTQLKITDFGAGSKQTKNLSNKKSISEIARHSAITTKKAQLLFKLVEYFQPKTILELGTSLGISTLFMSLAANNSETQIITFEGCPQIAEKAKENFEELEQENIEIIIGNIDKTLPQNISSLPLLDFVFLDANHRYKPTLNYFNQILEKCHNDTIIILDDIHWSKGMEKAWKEIIKNEKVTVSIDLFQVGLIFLRKEQPKQHFDLRF